MKSNQELSKEELDVKRKNLLKQLYVIGGLILLYAAYFIVKLTTKTWEANNMIGMISVGVLLFFVAFLSIQLSQVQKEINNR